jgi:hypothetical protein
MKNAQHSSSFKQRYSRVTDSDLYLARNPRAQKDFFCKQITQMNLLRQEKRSCL